MPIKSLRKYGDIKTVGDFIIITINVVVTLRSRSKEKRRRGIMFRNLIFDIFFKFYVFDVGEKISKTNNNTIWVKNAK